MLISLKTYYYVFFFKLLMLKQVNNKPDYCSLKADDVFYLNIYLFYVRCTYFCARIAYIFYEVELNLNMFFPVILMES